MGADTISLRSKAKNLRVCLEGGRMGPVTANGRAQPVAVQPTFIKFVRGQATIDRDTMAEDGKSTVWELLKAKTRAEAIAALKRWNGHGTEFWVLEVEVATLK